MRTLYTNGTVVTMDPRLPQAEALVLEDNTIIGVGNGEDMARIAGSSSRTVDMQRGTLFPGFNETHNHLSMYALCNQHAYLGACTTISELLAAIRQHYSGSEPEIYIGYSYDDTKLADGRQITRHDLDQIRSDVPVVVYHISAHLGFLNSKALDFFHIHGDTPSPAGGKIHKDQEGLPTGRLDELAWFNLVEKFPAPDPTLYQGLLEKAIADFNCQGITGVHDAGLGIEGAPQMVLNSYQNLAANRQLNVRTFLSALPQVFAELAPEPLLEFGDEMVKLGGVKLFIDGSIQAQTAALLAPYRGSEEWRGELVMTEEEFAAELLRYHRQGHHISSHGNGDAAIEAIITATEEAQQECPRLDARHMLIHCQMAHSSHLRRMKKIGMIPSFFGMHVHNWGDRHRDLFLGPERAERLDPAGEAEQIGLPFTLHVDTPVLRPQVLPSIETAITRKTSGGDLLGSEQRTTQYGAIAAYTSTAALCSHSERFRGTLTVGKLADMVLLDRDISSCAPERIAEARVLQTISDGRLVFEG